MSEQLYKLGYKALTCNRMSIISCFDDSQLLAHARIYRVLQKVVMAEGCGPLAVFNTLKDAKDFQCVNGSTRLIVPCVYKVYIGMRALWISSDMPNTMRLTHLPTGTILASEVICLE